MSLEILGHTDAHFAPLVEAFKEAFTGNSDMGAALSVYVDGERVAHLWGGVADVRTGKLWAKDTATVVFSCTKGLVSILAAQLVSQGRLNYDDPVIKHWPEFGRAGKSEVTVAQALAHRAGLSAPRVDLAQDDIVDWHKVTSILAAQKPLWDPRSGYAYHALTHGWVAGEIVRRVGGQSVGALLDTMVAAPLRASTWIGLPVAADDRVAHIDISEPLKALWAEASQKPAPNWPYKAMTLGNALPAALITETGGFNDRRIQKAEIPGAGGISTADGLAAIWSATVAETRGVRLLDDAVIALSTHIQSGGKPVFDAEGPFPNWGMGFQLDSEARRYLGPAAFGHDGAGGQVAFADPERRVGFAFVTNWMMGPEDQRATTIIDRLRELVGPRRH